MSDSDQGPPKKKKKANATRRTFRCTIDLKKSDGKEGSEDYTEVSWYDLLAKEEAKNRKAGIVPNSSTAAETPEKKGLDPYASDDEDQLKALAAQFESKYAEKPKKKSVKRKHDFEDLGEGYDESDPFIDNSECFDENVPQEITTAMGGFYINTGVLEFKDNKNIVYELSDTSDDESAFAEKKPKVAKKKAAGQTNGGVGPGIPIKKAKVINTKRKARVITTAVNSGPNGTKKKSDDSSENKSTEKTTNSVKKQQNDIKIVGEISKGTNSIVTTNGASSSPASALKITKVTSKPTAITKQSTTAAATASKTTTANQKSAVNSKAAGAAANKPAAVVGSSTAASVIPAAIMANSSIKITSVTSLSAVSPSTAPSSPASTKSEAAPVAKSADTKPKPADNKPKTADAKQQKSTETKQKSADTKSSKSADSKPKSADNKQKPTENSTKPEAGLSLKPVSQLMNPVQDKETKSTTNKSEAKVDLKGERRVGPKSKSSPKPPEFVDLEAMLNDLDGAFEPPPVTSSFSPGNSPKTSKTSFSSSKTSNSSSNPGALLTSSSISITRISKGDPSPQKSVYTNSSVNEKTSTNASLKSSCTIPASSTGSLSKDTGVVKRGKDEPMFSHDPAAILSSLAKSVSPSVPGSKAGEQSSHQVGSTSRQSSSYSLTASDLSANRVAVGRNSPVSRASPPSTTSKPNLPSSTSLSKGSPSSSGTKGSISNTTDQSKNQISGSQLSQQLGRQAVAQLMKSKHTGQSNVSSPQQSPASAPKTGGSGVGTGVTIHNAYSLNSLGNASSGGGNHKNLTKSQQKYHQHQARQSQGQVVRSSAGTAISPTAITSPLNAAAANHSYLGQTSQFSPAAAAAQQGSPYAAATHNLSSPGGVAGSSGGGGSPYASLNPAATSQMYQFEMQQFYRQQQQQQLNQHKQQNNSQSQADMANLMQYQNLFGQNGPPTDVYKYINTKK